MAKKGGNNGNHDYKGLIDFIIKEEGFLKKPTDIGDGKITLGSGLTDPKWHKLYKERGNKWSAEDNRKAVEEEVKTREKYLSDSFPNWGLLPKKAQEALIAYNYNYNFTPSNSPRMYKAAAAKDFKELGNQINATSKDPKFKNGLEDRRERERDYYFSGFSTPEATPVIPVPVPVTETPKVIFTEQPDAIRNYRQPITPSNTRRDAYKAMQDKVNFNRFMDSISIQNTLPPVYEPQSNLHSEGGQMETVKLWEELSIPEKAAMMRVAVKNGITNLQDIKREYNEFAKGGPKKKPSVNPTAQRAMRYFMDKGLTDYQAAGLVGNLMRESGMSPTAVNSSSGAYGLAQWLGSRKKALFNKYGNNPTLNQQLDFVWNELNSTHKKGLKALKSSKSAEEAARNAMGYYEFMAGPDAAVREMRKYGQDGEGSMRKGINYASILMGHSPSKSPIIPTTPIASINPSISQESLESPIPFTPFNPEAFFATPETYQQPIVIEEPEAQEPIAISPYSPEEIERQERMNRLSAFNRILSLTNPYPQEEDSFLSTIGLLTGNTFSKGGGIHIKPSHRGRLTELKKRTGKSEAELYKTGGPAVRKMITFARSARKWKHGLGGNLFGDGGSYSYTKPLDNVYVDTEGNLLDPSVPSAIGTVQLPDVVVSTRDPRKPIPTAFDGSIKPWLEVGEMFAKPLNVLSPSQQFGAVADAVQGKRNYFESVFNGNSGFFTDKYAEEHPYITMAGNIGGDILSGVALSKVPRLVTATKPIIEKEGLALTNPFTGNINWVGKGMGSYIEVSPTADGWLGVDYINSTRSGTGRKLYDAAIEEAHKLGLKGVKSGESLASAPKTYNIWKHYSDKALLGNYGSHGNGNMINGPFTTKVNTPEELVEATQQGIDAAVIKKAPVYGLTNPSNDVPLLSFSRSKTAPQITAENAAGIQYQIEQNVSSGSLEETAKSVDKGRNTLLDWIRSPFYKARLEDEPLYRVADDVVADAGKMIEEVPVDISKTKLELDPSGRINGVTKTRPAIQTQLPDGTTIVDLNTGLDVNVASDLGKDADETTLHELLHYMTANSKGTPISKAGEKIIEKGWMNPTETHFDAINIIHKNRSKGWQDYILDQNNVLLPQYDSIVKMVMEEPNKAISFLEKAGKNTQDAQKAIQSLRSRYSTWYDIQEQRAYLQQLFHSKIRPNIKNPNDATEIEEYLSSHPEILENFPAYKHIQEVRPGSLKDYAKYFSAALGTIPFIFKTPSKDE